MNIDFFVLLTRIFLLGMVVIGLAILFVVIISAGVIDNIFHAVKKSKDDSIDEKSKKKDIILNIISAAVLMIPIILVLVFFAIA